MEQKIIAVDFDGTCVTHAFPDIGVEIGAPEVLHKLVAHGHKLILYTMRSNNKPSLNVPMENREPGIIYADGQFLTAAKEWFEKHKIPLYGVNINPTQMHWTTSPKAYAEHYIDDAAVGAPLKFDKSISEKPFINWTRMEVMLIELGLLPPTTLSIVVKVVDELQGTIEWQNSPLLFNGIPLRHLNALHIINMDKETLNTFHSEIILKHFVKF